jgi:hypothetical protein
MFLATKIEQVVQAWQLIRTLDRSTINKLIAASRSPQWRWARTRTATPMNWPPRRCYFHQKSLSTDCWSSESACHGLVVVDLASDTCTTSVIPPEHRRRLTSLPPPQERKPRGQRIRRASCTETWASTTDVTKSNTDARMDTKGLLCFLTDGRFFHRHVMKDI